MKKLILLSTAMLLLITTGAFAKTVYYTCPAPSSIKSSKCRYSGSGTNFSSSCLWQAKLNVTPPLIQNKATTQFLTAGSLAMPKEPYQLLFVQYIKSVGQMRCGYLAQKQVCPKGHNCYHAGTLQWGPLPGNCRLLNARVNPRGSVYCIGGAKTCRVVCQQ